MNRISVGEEIEKVVFFNDIDGKKKFLRKMNEESEPKTTMLMIATLLKVDNAETQQKRAWYDFSESMVDASFVDFEAKSIITLQSYLSIIKKYLAYVTPQSDTMKIGLIYTIGLKKEDLYKYINKLGEELRYITPKEFDSLLEESKAPSMCKCLFILTYLGVKGNGYEDVVNIRVGDINFETGEITQNGKELCTIPEKYIGIFKDATINEEYIKVDHKGNIIDTSVVYLDTPYLMKRKVCKRFDSSQKPDKVMISNTFADMKTSLSNPEITISSLHASGLSYRLLERCGMAMPRHKELMDFRDETECNLGFETMKACCTVLLEKLKKED